MRVRLLPLIPILAGCAAADLPEAHFIEDFVARSEPVRCDPIASLTAREAEVGDVVALSDTSFLVLYPRDREVALIGPDLEPWRTVAFEEVGPTGVRRPTSAALVGDSLLYIADQSAQSLKRLDLAGRDRGSVRLPFPPQGVHASPDGVLVTPFVMGRHPGRLVHRLEGDAPVPIGAATLYFGDMVVNTMANLVGLASFVDGRIVAAHQFIVPFAHVFWLGSGEVQRVPLPVPDGLRGRVGRVPATALTEANAREIAAVALATAADHRTGDLLYLTHTGREHAADGFEKAIVRLDPALRYRRSYLLDVDAVRFTYLTAQARSLVVDQEDRWYSCPTS